MVKIAISLLIIVTAVLTLTRTWLGISAYYLLALMVPQNIWWWGFEGLRVSLVVAWATLASLIIGISQNKFDINYLKTKLNFWLLLLWLLITLSYLFGPFVSSFKSDGINPDMLFSMTNKMFLFYFCSTLVIDNPKKLKYLIIVYVIATAYLIYWANVQYFTSNWDQFSMGRLKGPRGFEGGSIYEDENAFAMLFVTGLPFIYYMGVVASRKWLKYALWAIIPLGWHAVFLTGSRGGLLGLVAITMLTVLKSDKRKLAIPLILLFIIFYQMQAGSTMKDRSELIAGYEGEGSAEQRLVAWKGGMQMVLAYPFFGVGLGSFITALPHFASTTPRVAHNTFVQYIAESGIGAGISFVVIAVIFYKNNKVVSYLCRKDRVNDEVDNILYYNEANFISFTGFLVSSLFLSLNTYEVFFYLLIVNNSLKTYCTQTRNDIIQHSSK
jgi:probable O-glycosylation ligase (exosortase A-associated)